MYVIMFLKEYALIWAEINFQKCITFSSQFKDQSIWNNSLLRIYGPPIFFKD